MTKNNQPQQADKNSYQQAYNKGVRLLARREHSKVELQKKLAFFSPIVVQSVLSQLQQQGYQNDERFTHSIVQSRIASGKGYQWIKQELKQHQISDGLILQYLDQIDQQQWQSYCYRVWQKKFAQRPVGLKGQAMESLSEEVEGANIEDGDEETLKSQEDYQQKMKHLLKQQSFLSQRGFRPEDWRSFLKKH